MTQEPTTGDYVLATKYHDGDPGDHFAVGFLASIHMDATGNPRYVVVDSDGKPFRASGFRRVKRISRARGAWLVERLDTIEQGSKSVWAWARTSMKPKVGKTK